MEHFSGLQVDAEEESEMSIISAGISDEDIDKTHEFDSSANSSQEPMVSMNSPLALKNDNEIVENESSLEDCSL